MWRRIASLIVAGATCGFVGSLALSTARAQYPNPYSSHPYFAMMYRNAAAWPPQRAAARFGHNPYAVGQPPRQKPFAGVAPLPVRGASRAAATAVRDDLLGELAGEYRYYGFADLAGDLYLYYP